MGMDRGFPEVRFPYANKNGDADGGDSWDFNDSGPLQDRWLRYPLYEKPLQVGQNARFHFKFMESDMPVVIGIGGTPILETNSDDYIGSFNLTVTNENGIPKIQVQQGGDTDTLLIEPLFGGDGDNPGNAPNGFFIRMKGSGSEYDCYINVLLV